MNLSNNGSKPATECLNTVRLPARLDVAQTAAVLGFRAHDIAVLAEARLLRPLGKPRANSVKFFAACEVEKLRDSRQWLDVATRTIGRHWQRKNGTFVDSCEPAQM